MRRVALGLAVLLTACTGGSPSVVTTPDVTTVTAEPSSTSPVTSSAASTTVTHSSVPVLDRAAGATAARLQADVDALVAGGPRVSGTASEAATLEWFADRARAATGIVPALQPVPLPNGTESGNVWVGPIGSEGPVLLVGAHIDSIAGSPGADDNGSGVVILLEVMRRLAEAPPSGVQVVFVAFGAEEFVPGFDHHYGSKAAVAAMEAAGTLPDFMLSVDMVGIGEALHAVPHRGSGDSFARDLVAIAGDVGIELVLRPRGDISDHVPFAMAGVPSAMLLRGDNPAYHTPEDDGVEIEAVLETLAVVEAVIARLDERPG